MPARTAEFDLATAAAFAPTSNQRRLINAIHDYPSVRTVREFCEHCDISRTTYYNWCKNPVFRLWFATAWSARLLTEGTTLINQARAKSSYKFPYWKALADLTFDPHGLALLQKWQQAMFTLDGSAFDCGPEAAPEYDNSPDPSSDRDDDPPQNAANHVNPAPEARVANSVQNLTLRAPSQAVTESSMGGDGGGGPRNRVPSAASERWGGRNSEGRTAVVNRIPPSLRSAPNVDGASDAVKRSRGGLERREASLDSLAMIPRPVAVARHFRRALTPARRHRCALA